MPTEADSSPPPSPAPSPAERLWTAASRAKKRAQLRLLRVRYVLGYLAGSLLVSVPIDVGYQLASGRGTPTGIAAAGVSIGYGLVCVVGFFVLRPLTQIPWERVRVPEFAVFEMHVAAFASAVSLLLLAVSLALGVVVHEGSLWLPPRLFWTVFVLVGLAWVKLKVQTLLFPEFYADRGGEKILSLEDPPEAGAAAAPVPPGRTP